ncbi:MAG: hypothetical protein FD166_2057 [Bacteroidetes bacterium]|nr:MAG: hypothetical protein FD166_2057 [Bacteroidota bacterium]
MNWQAGFKIYRDINKKCLGLPRHFKRWPEIGNQKSEIKRFFSRFVDSLFVRKNGFLKNPVKPNRCKG